MRISRGEWFALVITLIAFAVGCYVYPLFPERVAAHWNTAGRVNGYVGKFWGAFLVPAISALMFILFAAIPRLDPKRENIERFRRFFDWFIALIFLFLLYLDGLTIAWNLGHQFNIIRFLIPALAIIFYAAGGLVARAKPNWTIGIRTPWTLSSDIVWQKTHRLGAILFKASAVVSLLGMVFVGYAIWFVLVPAAISTVFVFVYSCCVYRAETGRPV